MGAIAGLALAFAFLPTLLSVALTVAVVGVLALEGMRLPLITSGSGPHRWLPWVIWTLALLTCPVAMYAIGALYRRVGPPSYDVVAARVVEALGLAHLVVSVVASIAVVILTRGFFRWLAWAAVIVIGAFTAWAQLINVMETTGYWL
jgi:hypothetical protein